MDPASVLRLTRAIGGDCAQVVLLGCEPASFGDPDEGRLGLSESVARSVDVAATMAVQLAADWLKTMNEERV